MSHIRNFDRRSFLRTGSALAVGTLAAPSILRAQDGPIVLGHLTPRTGFLGPLGEYAVMAVDMAVAEINAAGGLLGQQIAVVEADTRTDRAEAAKAKAATQTAAADGGRYMMQCAALRSQDSAESLKARIAFGAGLSSSLQVVNGANGTVYKVMVGPFSGKAAVDAANRKLQSSGISGCIPKKG